MTFEIEGDMILKAGNYAPSTTRKLEQSSELTGESF